MTDENAGKGGAYVLDPKTGKRRLVERTEAPKPEKTPEEAPKKP